MNNQAYFQVVSIIEEIELTEKLLRQLRQLKEPLNKTLVTEIKRKKRNLVKEMLKNMIDTGVSFSQFEELYQQIFSYLKAEEKAPNTSTEFHKNAKRVAQFLS